MYTYIPPSWIPFPVNGHHSALSRVPVLHSRFSLVILCVFVLVTQSRLTLCNPMGCSPPGSSVHGILQARKLEWVAIRFSKDVPDHGTQVFCIAGRFFTAWATRGALSILYIVSTVYICQSPSTHPFHTPFSPFGVHTSVLYICVSISALHIGSYVRFVVVVVRFHVYWLYF